MPSRLSISRRVEASSLSLPFMNFEAKASMFLPSVTSVVLEARAASSLSMGGGAGNCEVCAISGVTHAAARTIDAMRFFTEVSLLLIGVAVVGQSSAYFIERVIGDSQRFENLFPSFFTLAPLNCLVPGVCAAQCTR